MSVCVCAYVCACPSVSVLCTVWCVCVGVWFVGVVRASFLCRSCVCLIDLGSQVNAWICARARARDLEFGLGQSASVRTLWELLWAGFRHSAGFHARVILDGATCRLSDLGDVRDVLTFLVVW